MTKRRIDNISMQELWGGTDQVVRVKPKKNKKYCIQLGENQFLATNSQTYLIVYGIENADVFYSSEEAEEFLRYNWIDGLIVEVKNKNK